MTDSRDHLDHDMKEMSAVYWYSAHVHIYTPHTPHTPHTHTHTHTHTTHTYQVVITANEFDAVAVNQSTGIPAVGLPTGTSSLPPEVSWVTFDL